MDPEHRGSWTGNIVPEKSGNHKTELPASSSSEGQSRLKGTETRTVKCRYQWCQRGELGALPPTEEKPVISWNAKYL